MRRNIQFKDIYANYKSEAVALLQEQIKNEKRETIVQTDYEDPRVKCIFSMVELNGDGKLLKIYHVFSKVYSRDFHASRWGIASSRMA